MFCYCLNNPVRYEDSQGNIAYDNVDEDANNDENVFNDTSRIGNQSYKSFQAEDLSNTQANPEIPHGRVGYTSLPRQGTVVGNPNAPAVDAGSQGKHVIGHNNYTPGKTAWPEGETGVQQTQEAWMNGTQCGARPYVRIGVASDGTTVCVHMNGLGWIHGYPIYHY